METTRTDLLAAVQDAENTLAWSRFYHIYATMVRHFVRRLGLPDAEADDVTQEVMLVAHKALQERTYDPARGRFRSWLYGVAHRQSLAAMRARRRRTRAPGAGPDAGASLLDRLEDRDSDASARQMWQEEWRYALLDEALTHVQAHVGNNAFEAFRRYALQGRPAAQVAGELGIAPSSVYVYKGRVLAAIRERVRQIEGL